MIDFDNLDKMIAEKYISVQKHPTLDLYIYNYTQKAQFSRVWNNETLQCRGLILDSDRNVVSRPFGKFFNLGELGDIELPEGDFTVTEKMDGSLGISYFDPDGNMYLATRGSFTSEQANVGTGILKSKYRNVDFSPAFTWLFEIIYPQNRIVVDYGKTEDIIILAAIDTKTGKELDRPFIQRMGAYISVVKQYDGITDFKNIEQRPNSEGYVVHFPSTGLRFKVKFDEYVRLHKIITGINAKRVWEILSSGQSLDDILDRVPDEFYKWVKDTANDLQDKYDQIASGAYGIYEETKFYETRKEQAQFITENYKYPSIVFRMLDDKDYASVIWKIIEPKFERPFKVEI